MNKQIVLLAAIIILVAGCSLETRTTNENTYLSGGNPPKEPVTGELTTEDSKNIAYTFYENPQAKFGIVLLHMLDKDRHDFDNFAKLLQTTGYAAISIDLRGHGESTQNWRWRAFSDKDFRMMTLDAKSAVKFLQAKELRNIILIGASIGANTALNYGIKDAVVKAIVLLSAGLDYRGVKIKDSIVQNTKPTLVVASEDDLYAFTTSKEIHSKSKSRIKDYQYYKNAGHGTDIFAKEKADLHIIDWLIRNELR